MSTSARLRRPAVLLGVVLVLLAGAATIRAAAAWTAASSPLESKPPSVESLQTALAAEQARSITLQAQFDALVAGSADLTTALQAARDRIADDGRQAEALQASLEAAKARLKALERSIPQARPGEPATVPVLAAAVAPARGHDDDGVEHEGGDDD